MRTDVSATAGAARAAKCRLRKPLDAQARALAGLDALAARAERAAALDRCRPRFGPGPAVEIVAGRHPVMQAPLVETSGADVIANEGRLDACTRLLVITGPNSGVWLAPRIKPVRAPPCAAVPAGCGARRR